MTTQRRQTNLFNHFITLYVVQFTLKQSLDFSFCDTVSVNVML